MSFKSCLSFITEFKAFVNIEQWVEESLQSIIRRHLLLWAALVQLQAFREEDKSDRLS